MSNIVITTHEIKNNANELDNEKKYYYSKKAIFTRASFGATGALSNYLLKINTIYEDISTNIENLSNYLKDYANDVEGLENQISNKGGSIKAETVRSIVSKTKNTLKTHIIDESNIFEVVEYSPGEYRRSSLYYNEVNPVKRFFATTAISGIAFTEGIINVGEMLTDGLGTAASVVCTVFGNTDMAESLMEDVKKDKSGEWYYREIEKYGLDKYGNPNGAVAGTARIGGNVVGMVGLSVGTLGAGNAIGGTLASTGVVSANTGAVISTGSTVFLSGATGALRDAGIEAELAMQRGASVNEAQIVAGNAAAIGFITDAIAGKLNTQAAKATGVGQVIGYGVASFGVRSSDPLLNELSHTAVYDHDENLSFLENFLQNAKEYNLGLQMGIAGTAGSVATIFTGLKGLKTNIEDTTIKPETIGNSNTKDYNAGNNAKEYELSGNKTNTKTSEVNLNNKTIENNVKEKELDSIMGNIPLSEVERMKKELVEKITITSTTSTSTDIQTRLFTIDQLKFLLENDDRFNSYVNAINSEKVQVDYANAMKKMFENAKKYDYDLNLSETSLERAKYIIDNYSFEYSNSQIFEFMSQLKSGNNNILFSDIANYITSDEYKKYTQLVAGTNFDLITLPGEINDKIFGLELEKLNLTESEFNKFVDFNNINNRGLTTELALFYLKNYRNGYALNPELLEQVLNKTRNFRFLEITNEELERLSLLFSQNKNGFFESLSNKNHNYGVDQGVISRGKTGTVIDDSWIKGYEQDLFNFLVNVKGVPEEDAMKVVYNNYGKIGGELSLFGINTTNEFLSLYKYDEFEKAIVLNNSILINENEVFSSLKNKLKNQGIDAYNATKILETVDSVGACSYAATANQIFQIFSDNPKEFEEIFGYSMFKTIDGEKQLNSAELLLDLYLFANNTKNGGTMFEIDNNTIKVLDLDAENQVYLATSGGANTQMIDSFLKTKNQNLQITDYRSYTKNANSLSQTTLPDNYDDIRKILVGNYEEGYNIQMGVYSSGEKIEFLDPTTKEVIISTDTWSESGGHAVYVTEIREDGLIVSSWGQKLLIPKTSLTQNHNFTFNMIKINKIGE